MSPPLPLTRVRHSDGEARALLGAYVFGGRYGPKRVPRGLDPALVADWLASSVDGTTSQGACRRIVEVALFYEAAPAMEALAVLLALTVPGEEAPEAPRPLEPTCAALLAQAVGSVGAPALVVEVARRLDEAVLRAPQVVEALPELLQARLALAPFGGDGVILARLRAEVARAKAHEASSEQAMLAYDQLAGLERDGVPLLQAQVAEKRRLAALPPGGRAGQLVALYLGTGDFGGPFLDVWAARLLRLEALLGHDVQPIHEALEQAAAAADPGREGVRAAFRIVRAAQAVVYLGGEPSPDLRRRWGASAGAGGQSFLWDDP